MALVVPLGVAPQSLLLALCVCSMVPAQVRNWVQLSSSVSPPPRSNAAICWDGDRSEVLLFGGIDAASAELGDFWVRANGTWREIRAPGGPSPRRDAAMCYDATHRLALVVGGRVGSAIHQSAYAWDGQVWTTLPEAPGTVYRPVLLHDPLRGKVLLIDADDRAAWKGWSWDGTSWSTWASEGAPGRVVNAGIDTSRDRVVVVTLESSGRNQTAAIHEFDGVAWELVQSGIGDLGVIVSATMVPDPMGQGLLMQPLRNIGDVQVVRRWNGAKTYGVPAADVYGPQRRRVSACAVADPEPGMLIFGGRVDRDEVFDETWLLRGVGTRSSLEVYASGCEGNAGIPSLSAQLPVVPGSTLSIAIQRLSASRLNPAWGLLGTSRDHGPGGADLPIDLGDLGMPGCALSVSADFDFPLDNLGGRALWPIPIPLDLGVVGLEFHVQVLAFDLGRNAFGAVMSDAASVRIGTY